MRAALRSLVSFSLCKGTFPSLELRVLNPELPLRNLAYPKGSVHKSTRRVSEQPNGDNFRTNFPQKGVLRHQLVHLVLDLVDAWLKDKELAALLLSKNEFIKRQNIGQTRILEPQINSHTTAKHLPKNSPKTLRQILFFADFGTI